MPFTVLSSLLLIMSGGRYSTIYEAIPYAVFSNFLLLSAIQFYWLLITAPTHSLLSFSMSQKKWHTTNIKILSKRTHIYTSKASFLRAERKAKQNETALCIAPTSFPLSVFIPQFLLPNATPKYFKYPSHLKFHTMYLLGHVFMVWNCRARIHSNRRNLASQCITSL